MSEQESKELTTVEGVARFKKLMKDEALKDNPEGQETDKDQRGLRTDTDLSLPTAAILARFHCPYATTFNSMGLDSQTLSLGIAE